MAGCCDGYDDVFDEGFARKLARRYGRRGLTRPERAILAFLTSRGIEGATVLEIGGGVGGLHVELLRRGAVRAVNLEISPSYEDLAAQLLDRSGLAGRVERRLVDIAVTPHEVAEADVVVLHRVVCCYPDYERLLGAAGGKAGRLLVFSHPPRHVLTRSRMGCENLFHRLRHNPFRVYAHPPGAMVEVLNRRGLRDTWRWRGYAWRVVGLERPVTSAGARP